MASAIFLGLQGKTAAVRVATLGTTLSFAGVAAGVLMLLSSPLSIECAILTAYLVAMMALYKIGFGFGNIKNARLVQYALNKQA